MCCSAQILFIASIVTRVTDPLLQPGDELVSVDGVAVAGFSFARVRSAVVGSMGSVVELQVSPSLLNNCQLWPCCVCVRVCACVCVCARVRACDAPAAAPRQRRRFSSSVCTSLLCCGRLLQWMVFNGQRKVHINASPTYYAPVSSHGVLQV